jgi:hypothetical protein
MSKLIKKKKQTFIEKLAHCINESLYINWYNDNGFTINNKENDKLVEDLQKYKVTSGSYNSFLRQLSMYNFKNNSIKRNKDYILYTNNIKKYNKNSNFKDFKRKQYITNKMDINIIKIQNENLKKENENLKKELEKINNKPVKSLKKELKKRKNKPDNKSLKKESKKKKLSSKKFTFNYDYLKKEVVSVSIINGKILQDLPLTVIPIPSIDDLLK